MLINNQSNMHWQFEQASGTTPGRGELVAAEAEAEAARVAMDYFASFNGMSRRIVDAYTAVTGEIGEAKWRTMTYRQQDDVLNRKLMDMENAQRSRANSVRSKGHSGRRQNSLLKYKSGKGRHTSSKESLAEGEGVDPFAGPFSWDTKSVREMVFPATPEATRKQRSGTEQDDNNNHCAGQQNHVAAKDNTNQSRDQDAERCLETIDELRIRLTENYRKMKCDRAKYKRMFPSSYSKNAVSVRKQNKPLEVFNIRTVSLSPRPKQVIETEEEDEDETEVISDLFRTKNDKRSSSSTPSRQDTAAPSASIRDSLSSKEISKDINDFFTKQKAGDSSRKPQADVMDFLNNW